MSRARRYEVVRYIVCISVIWEQIRKTSENAYMDLRVCRQLRSFPYWPLFRTGLFVGQQAVDISVDFCHFLECRVLGEGLL